jgi:hypothetical protein
MYLGQVVEIGGARTMRTAAIYTPALFTVALPAHPDEKR